MISLVFIAAALLLVLYGLYLHISTLRWDETEIRELDQIELHLAHVLRMLEAPDVRILLDQPKAREDLLIEFSTCLKDDVLRLLKIGGLKLSSLLLVGLFFLSYHLMRFKARLFSGRHDLRFLSVVELALFRTMK
jgi:hypothetical protein